MCVRVCACVRVCMCACVVCVFECLCVLHDLRGACSYYRIDMCKHVNFDYTKTCNCKALQITPGGGIM